MMQAFDALFGGQRAGSARGASDSSRASAGTQEDANVSGGFDRMLQARGAAANPSARTTEPSGASAKNEVKPRDAGQPHASEESRPSDETKSSDTKAKDDARETSRAESKDDAPRESGGAKDDDVAGDSSGDEAAPVASDSTASASATNAGDAATPALPEQMLALLNGLAGATTAPAAATVPTAEALPPGLLRGDAVSTDVRGANGAATPVLPTLAGAQAAAAAPTDGDATAAFAMAMGAAASADAKTADASDTALDTTAIGDTAPASLPPVSTMTNHPLSRATAAAVQANAPLVMDDGFEDGFSSRIAWLADQKVGHAEIRVTPDHLGAIDVRLSLDGNRVNAEFHSAQPDVRHALESSLPRLRDMLGQQGLQLGQADVGQRQGQQQGAQGQPSSPFGGGSDRADAANDAGWTRGPAVRASRGLLDEYA